MAGNGGNLSQTTLLLRLLGGGYLVYLGVSILIDGTAGLLVNAGAAVLLLAGAGLLAITLPVVLRQSGQGGGPEDPDKDEE